MVYGENSPKANLIFKVTGLATLFWLLVIASEDRYLTETDKDQNGAQTTLA